MNSEGCHRKYSTIINVNSDTCNQVILSVKSLHCVHQLGSYNESINKTSIGRILLN